MSEPISVKERMPAVGARILFWDVHRLTWNSGEWDGEKWWNDGSYFGPDEVTHWMYLPPAPGEKP